MGFALQSPRDRRRLRFTKERQSCPMSVPSCWSSISGQTGRHPLRAQRETARSANIVFKGLDSFDASCVGKKLARHRRAGDGASADAVRRFRQDGRGDGRSLSSSQWISTRDCRRAIRRPIAESRRAELGRQAIPLRGGDRRGPERSRSARIAAGCDRRLPALECRACLGATLRRLEDDRLGNDIWNAGAWRPSRSGRLGNLQRSTPTLARNSKLASTSISRAKVGPLQKSNAFSTTIGVRKRSMRSPVEHRFEGAG